MAIEKVYLRDNVILEPLFNQWYAWPYLIAPASAAMYVANSHVKIMQSFIAAPQTHIFALKNPEMIGGPYINYDESRVGDIKALLQKTVKEQEHMLQFAAAVKTLDEMLANEATGFSLEPLYKKVPDILKGYVEMAYDLNNRPSIRFIERLLYKSPYYRRSSQSIALSLIERDEERSFALSTPIIEDNRRLHLKISFDGGGIDELFRMRQTPGQFGYIKELLGVADEQEELFASFFTAGGVDSAAAYQEDLMRVRYFGHACILIESRGVSIIIDPIVSYRLSQGVERHTYADLPEKIDYALITHNHQDHCMFETLLQLRHRIQTLVVPKSNGDGLGDPSLKLILQNIGFKNVLEIDEMESLECEGGKITALPFLGEHGDLNVRTKAAYSVSLRGKNIVCAADSNNIEPALYERLAEVIQEPDLLFIGMECEGAPMSWLYGPLMTRPLARKMDQSRRLNGSGYESARAIVDRLNPRSVYVYAMGQEPWLTYITSLVYTEQSRPIIESGRLIEDCRVRGIEAERLYCRKEIVLDHREVKGRGSFGTTR